jgi:hypothetical protein
MLGESYYRSIEILNHLVCEFLRIIQDLVSGKPQGADLIGIFLHIYVGSTTSIF